MVNYRSKLEAYWPHDHRRSGRTLQWYQSESWKPPRKLSEKEYYQRQFEREKEERVRRCVRQITQGCKGMLRKKLEEIEAFNSSLHQNKLEKNKCFYCRQKGHLIRTCPKKIMDDAESSQDQQNQSNGTAVNQSNTAQPEVALKYPEFIHFNTDGILKGTDQGSWDDFWYLSKSTDKHYCSNLNMFCNIRENFLVSNLEKQKKFLFTYGIGEVIIKPVFQAYLIPGVYFAPEVSLNILSIDLLNQQGFAVVHDGDRYRLEYMFRESTGNMLDLNKLRNMQNTFIEDYFEGLNQNRLEKKDEMARFVEDVNPTEVHTFQEFVGFLNLIKDDNVVSRGWDSYRDKFIKVLKWFYTHYLQKQLPGPIPPIIHGIPIHLFDLYKLIECMGGYLSVHFGQEFGAIAEILGLTRNDGDDVKKVYMVYLDVFVSYYKTARAPQAPAEAVEDSSLESYQWSVGKNGAPSNSQKGKEKIEHFGIKLEDKPVCIQQQTVQDEEKEVTCYRCHSIGHYAYQCPSKQSNQMYYKSYKDSSSSKLTGNSSRNTSNEDLNIII
ncbi:ARID DNA-binding domain-containing protein [Tanacetum coccineum]